MELRLRIMKQTLKNKSLLRQYHTFLTKPTQNLPLNTVSSRNFNKLRRFSVTFLAKIFKFAEQDVTNKKKLFFYKRQKI